MAFRQRPPRFQFCDPAMDGWHLALLAFAVYLAVRTLLVLMKTYENDLRRKLEPPAPPAGIPSPNPSPSPQRR